MYNIHLSIVNIVVFLMLLLCFLMSPFLGGKGRIFIKPNKDDKLKQKNVRKYKITYIVFVISLCVILILISTLLSYFWVTPLCIVIYISFCVFMFNYCKTKLGKFATKEYVLNNTPKEYRIKTIGLPWYMVYLIPPILTAYFCKLYDYALVIVCIELCLMFFSIMFRYCVNNFASYVNTDSVDDSIKSNIIKRKLWCICAYVIFLLVSVAIMTVYFEYNAIFVLVGVTKYLTYISYGLIFILTIIVCIIKGRKS